MSDDIEGALKSLADAAHEEVGAGKIGSDPNETRQEYIDRVTAEGMKVCLPGETELFIDIDNEQHFAAYVRSFDILRREVIEQSGIEVTATITPSASGLPCRHIRINLPWTLTPLERIAWQAALGSDPVREVLSLLRWKCGDIHPTIFAERAS